jgi:hypothetical protein
MGETTEEAKEETMITRDQMNEEQKAIIARLTIEAVLESMDKELTQPQPGMPPLPYEWKEWLLRCTVVIRHTAQSLPQ